MTQNEMILKFLQENGQITTYDAFKMGITRLSARIYELKERGHNIVSERRKHKARDGKVKQYELYKLGAKDGNL